MMISVRNVMKKVVVFSVLVALYAGAKADAQFPLVSPALRTRPLTPGERTTSGLTNTTQLASGIPNEGVGTPIYLEVLVTNKTARGLPPVAVSNVVWSFVNRPTNSVATLLPSPLLTSGLGMTTNISFGYTNYLNVWVSAVTNLTGVCAPYDIGDRQAYSVAGRALLVPDVACMPTPTGDYIVRAAVTFTNGLTLYVTNTVYGSVYLGAIAPLGSIPTEPLAGMCKLCHNSPNEGYKMNTWGQTAHATAFIRKINGTEGQFKSTCISCHSVGYDATASATNGNFYDVWAHGSGTNWAFPTNLTTAALTANPNGATNNWNLMPASLQNKANIQCESCHGPADRHAQNLGDKESIGISLSAGNCGFCHDSMTHHVKNFEFTQSGHANGNDAYRPYAYVTNYNQAAFYLTASNSWNGKMYNGFVRSDGSTPIFGSVCGHCHSAQGFILDMDPEWVTETNLTKLGTGYEGLTCAVCHDPHSVGMGDYQLRSFSKVVLMNNYTNTLGGNSLICMQCHHDRKNGAFVDAMTVADANTYLPHDSPQTDMLVGQNAIEYGLKMPKSRHINVLEEGCIECHMANAPTNGPGMNHLGGHTWNLSYDCASNSTTYELTETCIPCHGEIEGFDFGGEDYDRDGVVEGVQSEVKGLLITICKLLPYSNTTTRVVSYGTTNEPQQVSRNFPLWWNIHQRKAAYNYYFVKYDASFGVHNPKYASAILQASVDDLRGGIDVDRNGLLDSWEITNFGSIGQDPSADSDGDGVVNRLEMAAGTNPRNADSDYDGFSDGVELAAGTDPLSAISNPSSATNTVTLLPAYELAFLAVNQGTTQQFQSVDALSGSWTTLGTNFISSSNSWYYQLISTRNATQRFFRVTTTN